MGCSPGLLPPFLRRWCVMVRAGLNSASRLSGMRAALPVTIMTAMSHRWRAPCQHHAVVIPERAAGTTTRQIVCHCVAPMAKPASRKLFGTASRASSATLMMVGSDM